MNKLTKIPRLTYRQVATILAALRYFQANLDDIDDLEIDYFEKLTRLNSCEIDELCQSINFQE